MTDALMQTIVGVVIFTIRHTLYLPDYPIGPQTRLSEDLGLTSFDLIKLTLALEDRFRIELPPRIEKKFQTVSEIAEFLSRRYFHDEPLAAADVPAGSSGYPALEGRWWAVEDLNHPTSNYRIHKQGL